MLKVLYKVHRIISLSSPQFLSIKHNIATTLVKKPVDYDPSAALTFLLLD